MKKTNIVWIAETAIFLALLIVLQAVTASLGQFVTGSAVNFVLVAAAVIGGLWSGIVVAAVSPFLAFLLGIGPKLIAIVPFIAVGNIVLVLVYALVMKCLGSKPLVAWPVGVVAAAVLKFAALYCCIVLIVLPSLGLPDPQVATMSAMFSWPQLVTALIGGVLAALVVPPVKKALKLGKYRPRLAFITGSTAKGSPSRYCCF